MIDELFCAVEELRIDVGSAHARISELETANHLQQETIEKLGDELATVKRELLSWRGWLRQMLL